MKTTCILCAVALLTQVGTAVPSTPPNATHETDPARNPTPTALPFSESSTLGDYLRYAFTESPGLKAAASQKDAAQHHVRASGALPSPELNAEYMLEQHEMQSMLGLRQRIPSFGKLGLRKKIA